MDPFQPYLEAAASIAPVTVPFLGVVLAVFLALRRFQKEQIWLKRLDAYTQLLNALHTCMKDYERDYENEIRQHNFGSSLPPLSPEQKAKVREAFDLLRRTAATGRLIISDRAVAALDHFFLEAGDVEGDVYHEYCERMAAACATTISDITSAGRAELNLQPSWVSWNRKQSHR